jgi:hypothetical protein
MQWSPGTGLTLRARERSPPGVSIIALAGCAPRVPLAAGTSGIRRTATVTSRGPVGWAPALDLQWGRRPELHGVINHRQQLSRERIQVDLVAQPGGVRLHRPGGVVLTAVEAAIHHHLDAATGWLEQGGHGQRGPGHRPARGISAHPAEQLAKDQNRGGVDASQ